MQRIDAMGNERQAYDPIDRPDHQRNEDAGSEIFRKEERQCRDREIENGGCAQKNASVGLIHELRKYIGGQGISQGSFWAILRIHS